MFCLLSKMTFYFHLYTNININLWEIVHKDQSQILFLNLIFFLRDPPSYRFDLNDLQDRAPPLSLVAQLIGATFWQECFERSPVETISSPSFCAASQPVRWVEAAGRAASWQPHMNAEYSGGVTFVVVLILLNPPPLQVCRGPLGEPWSRRETPLQQEKMDISFISLLLLL